VEQRLTSARPLARPVDNTQFDDDGIDLGALFAALWRKKWIVLACMLLGALLANVMVSRQTPLYTAQSSLMLDPRTVRVMAQESVVSDPDLNDGLMESAVAVLMSNLLLEEVIDSLEPELLAPLDPANAPEAAPGPIDALRGAIGGLLDRVRSQPEAGAETEAAAAPPANALSPEEQRRRHLVGEIRRSTRIWRSGDSYVIKISVETISPEIAARLANQIAAQYIARSLRDRGETMRAATTWLGQRAEDLRRQLEQAETRVEEARAAQLSGDGISLEAITQQQMQLNTQLAMAQADTATALGRHNEIARVIERDGIDAAAELVSSPFVLTLRQDLSQLRRQDSDLSSLYGPEHPERQRIAAQIELIDRDMRREIGAIVAGLNNDLAVARARESALRDSLAALEDRQASVSQASIELRQLEREADSARRTYEDALARFNETRTVEQFQSPDARLVERAVVPGGPSAPRPKLMTVFGGVVGFSIGLVLAFLAVFMRRGFGLPREVERATGVRVLAALPRGRWRGCDRMLEALARSPHQVFADRIRQLRAVLNGPRGERPPRSVLFTSPLAGDGKTCTALAFAFLEAKAGRRVLLLDLDMRRSPLRRALELAGGDDLPAYLQGRCSLDAAIRSLPDQGFDLLTTLTPAPLPGGELTPGAVRALLEELGRRYDRVVIDAPPLLSGSESLICCGEAEAVLLALRHRATTAGQLRDALQRLRDMQIEPAGLVMTMTDLREEGVRHAAEYSYVHGA